jgi:hypothetical protein
VLKALEDPNRLTHETFVAYPEYFGILRIWTLHTHISREFYFPTMEWDTEEARQKAIQYFKCIAKEAMK